MKFSSGFRKYFANTSWLLFGQVSRMVITLFVGIYVARYLGPSNFGLLSYAISFVALFSTIATLGSDVIVIRDLVRHKSKRDELLGTAFTIKGMGTILFLGILALATRFTSNSSSTNLLMFIIASAVVFRCFNVIDFHFQSKVLSKYSVYARMTSMISSAVIKLLFIYFRKGLIYFATAMLIESIVLAAGFITVYARQKLSIFSWRMEFSLAKTLLRDSWPLMLSGVALSIYMRIDQVMIKSMMDAEAVGNYAVAVRLSEAWYLIPAVIVSSVFPAIVTARKTSEKLYYERLEKLYALMIWSAIGIALPITFLADDIVGLLFGIQYQDAASVLRIYIWAGVFAFLGVASGRYLIAENYTKTSFFRTFIGMTINVVLNAILIPRFGIEGAAVATVVSYFAATFSIAFMPKTNRQAVLMLKSANLFGLLSYLRKR